MTCHVLRLNCKLVTGYKGAAARPRSPSPSTPDTLTKIMRDATHRILSDPKVVAEGDKPKRYIKYVGAAQTEKNIATVLKSLTPEQTAEIRQVVLGK